MRTTAWYHMVLTFKQNTIIRILVSIIVTILVAAPVSAQRVRVTAKGLGSGTIVSNPPGIDCGNDCEENFLPATSVLLTATPDPGSMFAGWELDCSGTSPSCGITTGATGINSIRAVFVPNAAIPPLTRSTDPGTGELLSFSPEEIDNYLTANPSVNTTAQFLTALPADFKQNWILMSRSESLQSGTAEFPRILLPSEDAKSVFTLGVAEHSSYPGSHPNAIEYMQWDAAENNFRFHEVVLDAIPTLDADGDGVGVIPARVRGVSTDDAKCHMCHSTQNVLNLDRTVFPPVPGPTLGTDGIPPGTLKSMNKPNWDTYDSWAGMMPFNRDRIYQGSVEAAAFRKLFNLWTWNTRPEIRSIIEQLELQPPGVPANHVITRTVGGPDDGHINFAFDVMPPVTTETAPVGTSTNSSAYKFDRTVGTSTSLEQGGDFITLHHSDSPTSDEGRGVQLFDLIGGLDGNLNPQRIAEELISHQFATGSVPIDVRPVALAISDGCFAIDTAGDRVESNTGLPALTVDANFFNGRHGMGINDLVIDTRTRAQSLTRRKADMEKTNLDRTVDLYTKATTDGLIQEYGDATYFGTSTSFSRLRQEVFRRPITGFSGDATVMGGIYVDREFYGFNTERIALYRYFLEPLGVSVDKWSMGVRGRSRTYTFADVFGSYLNVFIPELRASLLGNPVTGLTDPTDCSQLINAVNSTLSSLPAVNAVPKYTDVQRIFNKGCVECHGGLDYPPYDTYGSILDLSENETPAAGDDRLDRAHGLASARTGTTPGSSQLYQRVTDNFRMIDSSDPNANDTRPYDPAIVDESCPNFTGLMPCEGPPISQADMMTLRRWIVGGSPNTRGDPHIKTIDGINYDFQAAGEFVLLRDQNFELQVRQQAVETTRPLGPNPHTGLTSCVSLNSAVAFKVGPHRITYQPNLNGEPGPDGLQLRVDGEQIQLGAEGFPLEAGGRIIQVSSSGAIQVETRGGSSIVVTPRFWNHYQIWYMNIDARHIRATQGIMGAIPPGNWLPTLPDGRFMGSRPDSLHVRYDDLYNVFGNAWRVNDISTLFDYAPGTTTADFTIDSWPNGESPQSCVVPDKPEGTPPPLEPLPLETAQQLCNGVIDDIAKDNCIQDVAVTGEADFAQSYILSEQIEFNEPPTAPELVFPQDAATGVTSPVNFSWSTVADSDNDPVTYRHCMWVRGENLNLNNCTSEDVQVGFIGSGLFYILLVLLLGLIVVAILLLTGTKWNSVLFIITVLAVLFGALLANNLGTSAEVSKTVTNVQPGQSYYWKVIAEDSNGAVTESKTRYVTIQ